MTILGITFFNVDGTGPHGRILKGDVINYMKENNIEQIKPKLINFETKTGMYETNVLQFIMLINFDKFWLRQVFQIFVLVKKNKKTGIVFRIVFFFIILDSSNNFVNQYNIFLLSI